MQAEKITFLSLTEFPARLTSQEAAWKLGFEPHNIAALIKAKLLRPLGNPAPNAPKYFATRDVLGKADDLSWLDKATKAIAHHWKKRNGCD